MIKLTRLNGSKFWVSSTEIEFIESTPDTIISLVSGKKMIVTESPEEIVEDVIAYKQRIYVGNPPIVDKEGKENAQENS
ncbi:MAG: flagellar FlbD family protein [Candidatus Lindowbacteria bacterium]|nr:flagellar FlbD family protein [Candidatus Lindowbacteria bacterium]